MSWWTRKKKAPTPTEPSTAIAVAPIPVIEAELVIDAEHDPRYDVVYYKHSGFWAARFRGKGLYRWYSTGIVEASNSLGWTKCNSERDAWRLCNAHLEQLDVPTSQVYKTPSYSLK